MNDRLHIVTLSSGPPVRSDLERAYERIRELEETLKGEGDCAICGEPMMQWQARYENGMHTTCARVRELESKLIEARSQVTVLTTSERDLHAQLAESEEERLTAKEDAGNLQLRLDESLRREGKLNARLNNLDILAREMTEHVEKICSVLDMPASVT